MKVVAEINSQQLPNLELHHDQEQPVTTLTVPNDQHTLMQSINGLLSVQECRLVSFVEKFCTSGGEFLEDCCGRVHKLPQTIQKYLPVSMPDKKWRSTQHSSYNFSPVLFH